MRLELQLEGLELRFPGRLHVLRPEDLLQSKRMATLTIRLPDDVHERLRQLAKPHKLSVNKLIEELSIAALAEFDAETRFRVRAARGNPEAGLRLRDRLEKAG